MSYNRMDIWKKNTCLTQLIRYCIIYAEVGVRTPNITLIFRRILTLKLLDQKK